MIAPEQKKLAVWAGSAEEVAPVFEIDAADSGPAGRVEVWFDGALALAREQTRELDWRRTPSAIRSAPFDGVLLQEFGANARLELPFSGVNQVAVGDVVVLDMNRPFRLRAKGEFETVHVGLWIPTSRLPDKLAMADLQGLQIAAASPAGAVLSAILRALIGRAGAMTEAEFRVLAGGAADFIGRILTREVQIAERNDSELQLDTFVTARRFVERNLTSPKLAPQVVAQTLGLSRASLYRLFEPVGGLANYIRARRLQKAYEEITAPRLADRRIGPIAFALGFRSFSGFSRLFKMTYGVTPIEARRAALSGFVVQSKARHGDAASSNLFTLLAHLK